MNMSIFLSMLPSEIIPKTEEYVRLSLKKFLNMLPNQTYDAIIQNLDSNIFT